MATDPISRQNFTNPPQHTAEQAAQQANAGGDFGKVMATGLGVAASLAGKALGSSVGGPLLGGLGGGGVGATGIGGDLANQQAQFAELIQIQNQMQVQNQQVTMVSNVSKTEHETRMAAVRNIRS